MPFLESAICFKANPRRPAEGGDWMFVRLPEPATARLSSRGLVSVEGTINGKTFLATLQPDGEGGHWLKIPADLVAAAHLDVGSEADVALHQTTVEPEPEVPTDLDEALKSTPAALAAWQATTALARRDWIQWMTTGMKAETRALRLEKMMDMLSKGKKRICCFDRSGMYSKAWSCPAALED